MLFNIDIMILPVYKLNIIILIVNFLLIYHGIFADCFESQNFEDGVANTFLLCC